MSRFNSSVGDPAVESARNSIPMALIRVQCIHYRPRAALCCPEISPLQKFVGVCRTVVGVKIPEGRPNLLSTSRLYHCNVLPVRRRALTIRKLSLNAQSYMARALQHILPFSLKSPPRTRCLMDRFATWNSQNTTSNLGTFSANQLSQESPAKKLNHRLATIIPMQTLAPLSHVARVRTLSR